MHDTFSRMTCNDPVAMTWGVAGQSVIVTGAASGIGAAVADAFAAAGARVLGLDIDWPTGRTGACDATLDLDVTDPAGVRGAVDHALDLHGSPDVLVNSAGIMRARDSFFDFDEADWRAMYDVNVVGTVTCLQAVAASMRAAERGGAIVNVASIAGRSGRTFSPPYAASKAAVINLTRSAAAALAPHGIRVNAVAPGIVDTDMTRRIAEQVSRDRGLTPGEFATRRLDEVPLGRIGTAAEVAQAVLFLASPQAGYVTGQTLNVDGGLECN